MNMLKLFNEFYYHYIMSKNDRILCEKVREQLDRDMDWVRNLEV
jgi:hypothetical protein